MQIDLGTATIVGSIVSATLVGAASVTATILTGRETRRSTSKSVETGVEVMKTQLVEHQAQNLRDIARLDGRVDKCDLENDRQWKTIGDHTKAIGILKGRANGKAAGAHG